MDYVMIKFPKKLYFDVVTYSHGRADPESLLGDYFIHRLGMDRVMGGDELQNLFSDEAEDFAEKWLGDYNTPNFDRPEEPRTPLQWGRLQIAHGTEVRMLYRKDYHFAKVVNGRIVDSAGRFTPSEWASHIANNTSRNAWRDIEFRTAGSSTWILADVMRRSARAASAL